MGLGSMSGLLLGAGLYGLGSCLRFLRSVGHFLALLLRGQGKKSTVLKKAISFTSEACIGALTSSPWAYFWRRGHAQSGIDSLGGACEMRLLQALSPAGVLHRYAKRDFRHDLRSICPVSSQRTCPSAVRRSADAGAERVLLPYHLRDHV